MTMAMHIACKCHDSLCGKPRLAGNDMCCGNAKTRVMKMPWLISWKTFFHGKTWIFTRQILHGAMHVQTCKSEVINERYCRRKSNPAANMLQNLKTLVIQ